MINIDWNQVHLCIKYGLKQELRSGLRHKRAKSQNATFLIFMLFTGIYLGFFSLSFTNALTRYFVLNVFGFCYTFIFMLMEFPSLITGPEDYLFFSSRPVTRQTYFTAKIGLMIAIAGVMAVTLSLPLTIFQVVVHKSILNIFILPLTMLLSNILASLFVCTVYILVAALVPARIIKEVSSVLQLVLLLVTYLSISITRYSSVYGSFIIGKNSPFWLFPGGWATAFMAPFAGGLQSSVLLLYLFFLIFLFFLAVRIIKIDYRELITENETKLKRSANKKINLLLGSTGKITKDPEALIINKLFFNHLRHNSAFRTGLIAVLALTIFYFILVVFINRAPIRDPFTISGRSTFMETYLIYIAIGLSILMVKNQISFSSEAEASWFLFTAPARRGRYVKAARNLALRLIFFPYLLLIACVYVLYTGNILHTVMHFTVVGLIVFIITNIVFYLFPAIPFSHLRQRGHNFSSLFLNILFAIAFPLLLIPIVNCIYPSPALYYVLLATLITILTVLERMGPKLADNILKKQAW